MAISEKLVLGSKLKGRHEFAVYFGMNGPLHHNFPGLVKQIENPNVADPSTQVMGSQTM